MPRRVRGNEFDLSVFVLFSVQFITIAQGGGKGTTRGKSSKNSNSRTDNATKTHKNGLLCTFSSHHTTLLSLPSPALSAGGPLSVGRTRASGIRAPGRLDCSCAKGMGRITDATK